MKTNRRRDISIKSSKYTLRKMMGLEVEETKIGRMDRKSKSNNLLPRFVHQLDQHRVVDDTIENTDECRAKILNENSTRNDDYFTQTMYNITAMQHKTNTRFTSNIIPQQLATRKQLLSNRNVFKDTTRSTLSIAIAVAILSLNITAQMSAGSGEVTSSSSLASSSQDSRQNVIERSSSETNQPSSSAAASSAASSASPSSPTSQSSPTSIVASLSSAVASAAAAAAVAAAQNSLSSSDARSLISSSSSGAGSSNQHHHAHQPRSPGLNLAIKLADAIPEVPYSILHNMKKLDHAAPFYNVQNKVTNAGSSKESSHNLLSSALSASGGLGGAADHLSSLFRSPIWKRLADGYGEFTSEFRSLFRGPPTPMKGPSSSTTKLLRDISVPALLMLLASTFPTDWRPTKTRRKSLLPTDLSSSASAAAALDPMITSSSELPNFSLPPQVFRPGFNMPAFQPTRGSFNPINAFEQSQSSSNQLARVSGGDINLQPQSDQDSIYSSANWLSSTSQPVSMSQNFYETLPIQQQHQQFMQQQKQQPSIRRIGDSANSDSQQDTKPVENEPKYSSVATGPSSSQTNPQLQNGAISNGLFSSLTSSLANVKQSKLMNRIMNANGQENQQQTNSYRMMNLGDVEAAQKFSSFLRSRDHLNDKHRYSLVAPDDSELAHSNNNINEQQKLSPSSKPFLLSTMTHALTSMFSSPLAAESGSSSSLAASTRNKQQHHLQPASSSSSFDSSINGQQHSITGDKTLSRRQQQAGNGQEQRDLTQLLPASWKEVVKRTVNNVKQEASTQWRSIEGQLTNWVQDKLKTFPTSSSASSGSSSSGSLSPAAAPVANIIASVSSTAMNILGLGNKNPSSSSSTTTHSATTTSTNSHESSSGSSPASVSHESSSGGQRGSKNDSPSKTPSPGKGGALAGVANMIVNTLTSRTSAPSYSSSSSSHPKMAEDSGSVVSQYPTLTGAQPSNSQASVSSMASGTASTVAAMSTMMNN